MFVFVPNHFCLHDYIQGENNVYCKLLKLFATIYPS